MFANRGCGSGLVPCYNASHRVIRLTVDNKRLVETARIILTAEEAFP
jgi:hypothetical protein